MAKVAESRQVSLKVSRETLVKLLNARHEIEMRVLRPVSLSEALEELLGVRVVELQGKPRGRPKKKE